MIVFLSPSSKSGGLRRVAPRKICEKRQAPQGKIKNSVEKEGGKERGTHPTT